MSAFITIDNTGGTDITNASEDAQRIADLLGIWVEFKFNDVKCYAAPGGSAEYLAQNQQHEQARALTRWGDSKRAYSSRAPHDGDPA